MRFPTLLLLLAATAAAHAQSFETVSIHPSHSARPGGMISMSPTSDRLAITNVPLRRILAFAFDLRRDELILQAPEWARTERFDLLAKVAPQDLAAYRQLTNPQRRALLRTILADRCGLQAHLETRSLPAYALTLTKSGSRMVPSQHKKVVLDPDGKPTEEDDFSTAPGHFIAHAVPMASLAFALSTTPGMDRDVLDRTNLPGAFDFTLTWSPEPTPDPTSEPTSEQDAPSLFTAVTEQLGLKLLPITAPIQVLVVSALTRPTPN